MKELNKRVIIEQEKLSAIEKYSIQKTDYEETVIRLIRKAAQIYVSGIKLVGEQYAEYINNNTINISSDLTFTVQIRMKNSDFVER